LLKVLEIGEEIAGVPVVLIIHVRNDLDGNLENFLKVMITSTLTVT